MSKTTMALEANVAEVIANLLHHAPNILRVHPLYPKIEAVRNVMPREPHHLFEARGKKKIVALHFPIPDTFIRTLEGKLPAFFAPP